MRALPLLVSPVLLFALACAGAPPPPSGLHDWTEGELTLRLVEDGRGVVIRDGTVVAELELPHIPSDRYDGAVDWVDFDFDGTSDLRVLNADDSGAYNVFKTYYRREGDRYQRCEAVSQEHNVLIDAIRKELIATSLGNGVGSSGVRKVFRPHGCELATLATLTWNADMQTGQGEAVCTVGGAERWKEVYEGPPPDRSCP